MQPGCIFHSNRGCQYTSDHVRKTLGRWVEQSMSAKGYCYDNAFAETCFATIKAEMLPDSQIFESKLEAHRAVFDYIETFYNRIRRHSSLVSNFTAIFAALQQTTKHTSKLKHTEKAVQYNGGRPAYQYIVYAACVRTATLNWAT